MLLLFVFLFTYQSVPVAQVGVEGVDGKANVAGAAHYGRYGDNTYRAGGNIYDNYGRNTNELDPLYVSTTRSGLRTFERDQQPRSFFNTFSRSFYPYGYGQYGGSYYGNSYGNNNYYNADYRNKRACEEATGVRCTQVWRPLSYRYN